MLFIVANVLYVLTAVAMTVLILLQRGAGANAGSGFGGGASATVFGARGSANFLSRSTAVLAGLFFLLSLGMGMYVSRTAGDRPTSTDLGVMAGVTTPAKPADPAPAATSDVPAASAAPASDKPAAPAAPAAQGDKPAAPPPAAAPEPGK